MRSTVLAYAMSGLLATTAAAAERPVTNRHTGLIEAPLAGLRRAAEHTDRAELSRWAARIGAARLARALADPDRGLVLAVLDSLPHLSDRLLLLEPILACCESADPGLSERALRTLGTILSEADPTMLEIWEVPPETIDRACRLRRLLPPPEVVAISDPSSTIERGGNKKLPYVHWPGVWRLT